jgi:deoxyribonuclease IV
MSEIKVGPGGNVAGELIASLEELHRLSVPTMEVEFVRGIYMNNDAAKKAGEAAKKLGIDLSIHAPYYINLASHEKDKVEASKKRILDSCERGHYLGAKAVVFHPGYYQKMDKKEVYAIIREAVAEVMAALKKNRWDILLCPETTGKVSAFGTEEEILQLMEDTGCHCCIDFAHIYARNQGRIDYAEVLDSFKKLKHLQCHFSGIEYGDKGELRHIPVGDHPPFRPLAEELLSRKQSATIICEALDPLADALKMQKVVQSLKGKPL